MWNFLRPDSKFTHYAYKFCDLIALNLWMVISSLPVITIGASTAAMHYVLLKIYRSDAHGGITCCFWRAFRDNFKQATPVWLVFLLLELAIGFDLYLFRTGALTLPAFVKYLLYVSAAILYLGMNWFFILQSRYANPVKVTVRNALLFCIFHFLDTLLIGVFTCIPYAAALLYPPAFPLVLICGFALTGILCTSLYHRIFIKHEQTEEEVLPIGQS